MRSAVDGRKPFRHRIQKMAKNAQDVMDFERGGRTRASSVTELHCQPIRSGHLEINDNASKSDDSPIFCIC